MTKNAFVAVIGCGYWGKNLVRNFHELDALYAICDKDPKTLQTFQEKYPDIKHTTDISSLLSDSNIKAVAIATPAATHYALTKEALLADKDIFVEKPISLHYKEGAELVTLAQSKNKILMVGHLLEYHPVITKLKQMIDQGELGKINYVYSNRLNLGKFRTEENILWSFAPHDISVIINLLGEMPKEVSAHGGDYLNPNITDVTVTNISFPSGVKAHIFVSWLHPYKEQKLIVVGDKRMALFDDVNPDNKLFVYNHKVDWIARMPVPHPEQVEPVSIPKEEPLKIECQHFLNCTKSRKNPLTDGDEGLRVLKILEACQESLTNKGSIVDLSIKKEKPYFIHESAHIEDNVEIGEGTKIWHFSHVQSGARIGRKCVLGQNVNVGNNVIIGNNVKIQNNVSVYDGVTLEDDVFLGPSCVLTNVTNPRSQVVRKDLYEKTLIRRGATVGANATIVCGITLGRYSFIGAGAVVTKDVPDYALMVGNPARQKGWMSRHGHPLKDENGDNIMVCPESGLHYRQRNDGLLECMDLNEDKPLPKSLSVGKIAYRDVNK
jgi:UDP-2-acetamido-3-amino-2,3-dideoxy-glucuronate N-acetyltransferase